MVTPLREAHQSKARKDRERAREALRKAQEQHRLLEIQRRRQSWILQFLI